MRTNPTGFVLIALTIAAFLAGFYFYPSLPSQIASHWNADGQVNGVLPKSWGIFLWPTIMLGVFVLWSVIPLLEPLDSNLAEFRHNYNLLFIVLETFFLYGFALVLISDLGHTINLARLLAPALALLLVCVGALLKHSKRNFFVGIRTPWTLESDEVWRKTHALGAWLFYLCGLCALLGMFFPELLLLLVLLPIIIAALTAIIYSYVEFQHERV